MPVLALEVAAAAEAGAAAAVEVVDGDGFGASIAHDGVDILLTRRTKGSPGGLQRCGGVGKLPQRSLGLGEVDQR